MSDDWMRIRIERLREQQEREVMRKRLNEEMEKWTTRAQRAKRTADQVLFLVRDYIPEACVHQAYDEALLAAFIANAEIIEVPPECDALDKSALEKRRLELSMQPIMVTPHPR